MGQVFAWQGSSRPHSKQVAVPGFEPRTVWLQTHTPTSAFYSLTKRPSVRACRITNQTRNLHIWNWRDYRHHCKQKHKVSFCFPSKYPITCECEEESKFEFTISEMKSFDWWKWNWVNQIMRTKCGYYWTSQITYLQSFAWPFNVRIDCFSCQVRTRFGYASGNLWWAQVQLIWWWRWWCQYIFILYTKTYTLLKTAVVLMAERKLFPHIINWFKLWECSFSYSSVSNPN